jgi:hypothetical protein
MIRTLADLTPGARRLFFRLRNHALRNPGQACACCGRAFHIATADYVRLVAGDDDGAALPELLEAGALLGVFDETGACHGAAVIVDFGSPDEGHCG